MASRKGSRRSKMEAQATTKATAAALARVRAAVDVGMARKVAKTTKGKPVAPKRPVGRPPLLGPDGQPAKCGVAECDAPFRCMGYCSAHYQFARKTREWKTPQGPADKATGAWPMPLTKTNWRPRVVGLPVPKVTRRWAS